MIKANFNTYASYVTDSLYQWDLNQVLSVTGLNLAVVPEVHFSNANTDRAIVRQATKVDQVVSVGIPNSLLQEPLRIRAHIGIYEGDTFKVVELVEIPVIARKRPSDYQIQDSDEEIYSFQALENAIANMVKVSDFNTNKASINASISTLETSVNARIDNIIAHNNDTEGNTELVDIRAGLDGKVYKSAGSAIREQLSDILNCFHVETGANVYNANSDRVGFVMQKNGTLAENEEYTLTGFIFVPYGYALMATCAQNAGGRAVTTADATAQIIKSVCVFAADRTTIISDQGSDSQVAWYANVTTNGDKWVRITVKPATCPELMLEVVPVVNGTTSGEPNAYQTGLTLTGLTEYVDYVVSKTLLPECIARSWYYGKKIAVLGDSITELNLWQSYISNYFGCEMVNYGVGGSRVADYPVGERSDYMCGDDRINDIPSDTDVILVFGGHNDFSVTTPIGEIVRWWTLSDENSKSEFYSAYALLLKKLTEQFPKAKIITMSCVGGRTSSETVNEDGQWYLNNLCMEDYAEAVKRISKYYGIPCIDVGGESGINTLNHTTYIADVIHPNEIGGKLIANCVINGLKRFEPIDL